IQNGERKAYVLKSKELTGPTKGVIFLEIDVIFNAPLTWGVLHACACNATSVHNVLEKPSNNPNTVVC
ncbi:Multiple C2 and transmembrane domain-containing protein 1, partial [Larimichthys crocea]